MIRENLNRIEERINSACLKAGRDRNEVRLIAVSKTYPLNSIMEVFNIGVRDFGENKALELRDKSELINENICWHFIGHLQTNKVKYVIKSAEYIHSVESAKLAEEINVYAGKAGKDQKIFLEVNTSNEESKFGLRSEIQIFKLAEYCRTLSNIRLCGLMTMAPFTNDENIIRNTFAGLREYREKLNKEGFEIKELSMGMTNDFEIAIEEGATMLRIGTAIFGNRV